MVTGSLRCLSIQGKVLALRLTRLGARLGPGTLELYADAPIDKNPSASSQGWFNQIEFAQTPSSLPAYGVDLHLLIHFFASPTFP